jgi:hypothetical protein
MVSRTIFFSFAFFALALAPTTEAKVEMSFRRKLQQTGQVTSIAKSMIATSANSAGQILEGQLVVTSFRVIDGMTFAVGTLAGKVINQAQGIVGTVAAFPVNLPVTQVLGACNTVHVLIGAPVGVLMATLEGSSTSVQILIAMAMLEIKAAEATATCIVNTQLFGLLGTVAPIFQLVGSLTGTLAGLLGSLLTGAQLGALTQLASALTALLPL